MNRRYFFSSLAVAAAAAPRARSANDRVSVGVIGVRGRGKSLLSSFASLPDVDIAYLCDVDRNVLEKTAAEFGQKSGKKPRLESDLRRLLDDKSLDAVVVATPDHWHAPATILACQAGKDVYVEKPCSHNVREGRLMVEAARKHNRIVQHGTQTRSRAEVQWVVDYIHSGKIGKVLMAKAWNVQLRSNIGHQEDAPVPAGVDYDTWTGPAPVLPFNPNRFHYNWHWHWNYGTGDAGNDGVHQIDVARWALGVEAPTEVSGMGGKLFFDDDQQTPDSMTISYKDRSGKMLLFEMRIWNPYKLEGVDNGVGVYGTDGMVHIGRWRGEKTVFKVFDRKGELVPVQAPAAEEGTAHQADFISCVRSRKAPNAEIEIGFRSSLYAHLGNIVARTGRSLKYDPEKHVIVGDPEANRLIGREYRKHWSVPKGV